MNDDTDGPLYVYGVIPSSPKGVAISCTGVADAPVYPTRAGRIAALVSQAPVRKVRPTRANLRAHEDVVSGANRPGPVLPLRFGTVMPGERALKDEFLQPNLSHLTEMLDELAGKDEFRLRAGYLPEVAFREILERNSVVRKLRDRVLRNRQTPVGVQLELGELVLAELERLRESDSAEVTSALSPYVVAWRALDDPADDVALRAAFLVDRSKSRDWDAALEVLASKQATRLHFEVVGPLPAWDFVDPDIGLQ